MKINVILGLSPPINASLDASIVRVKVLYGTVTVSVEYGGLVDPNSILLPENGDFEIEDRAVAVVA